MDAFITSPIVKRWSNVNIRRCRSHPISIFRYFLCTMNHYMKSTEQCRVSGEGTSVMPGARAKVCPLETYSNRLWRSVTRRVATNASHRVPSRILEMVSLHFHL